MAHYGKIINAYGVHIYCRQFCGLNKGIIKLHKTIFKEMLMFQTMLQNCPIQFKRYINNAPFIADTQTDDQHVISKVTTNT